MCKYTKGSWLVHTMFIIDWYYKDSSKELHKTDVVMFFITHKFFHNNRPGKPLPGHSSFISPYFGGFFYFTGYNIIDIRVQKNVLKEMHCENMWHAIIQIINKE